MISNFYPRNLTENIFKSKGYSPTLKRWAQCQTLVSSQSSKENLKGVFWPTGDSKSRQDLFGSKFCLLFCRPTHSSVAKKSAFHAKFPFTHFVLAENSWASRASAEFICFVLNLKTRGKTERQKLTVKRGVNYGWNWSKAQFWSAFLCARFKLTTSPINSEEPAKKIMHFTSHGFLAKMIFTAQVNWT